jgi:glyoxylase-like metal-dependent hydrolase (beta-lactamase superfamily II)/rhodanese-related sulfurtransferase
MSDVPVIPLVDLGLGNSTYLIDLGDGRAMAVDPSRDLRAVEAAAAARRLRVVYSAETHLHADFLSGSVQLAAGGAQVLASAAGGRSFTHRGLADEDEVDLGGLTLKALTTPGHTAEHLSYLLLDGATPLGVFTGGSLLVGAAARTDLAGAERTEELARAQYRSLQRLARLPESTLVYPTHGAGSFCSAPPGAERTSSIGAEKATNPYLAARDEDAFVARLLASLGSYPPYFDRLGEVNRRGPALLGTNPALTPLSAAAVESLRHGGAEIIDVRTYQAYAATHIPGSLSIPLREVFATWLGWLVPSPATPLVIVRDPDQDPEEVIWQAHKIGYERLAGELTDGLAAWTATRYPVVNTRLSTPAATDPTTVIDVRQAAEFAPGHLPGAVNIELGNLSQSSADLSGYDVVVMCGHGERAATAASVLERAGVSDVTILSGGPQDWADAGAGRILQIDQ